MTTDETSTKGPETPAPTDDLVTTHHTISTVDGDLSYTATTGRIVLGSEKIVNNAFTAHTPLALMGVTAYTLDDIDPTTRPLTFVFNGGPGSSSVWLHMGLVGPRVVDPGTPEDPATPPFHLMDNEHTLLRETDLVVIDAMSTGYSRVVDGEDPTQWHGWSKDVELVSELIRLWVTRHGRWASPLYLLGESYGTVRAVSVAQRLQDTFSMYLNGIILVSSVLDFGNQDFEDLTWDRACVDFLPTYAAVAHYHGHNADRSLEDVLAEAEEFAVGPYRQALAAGHRLDRAERGQVTETMSRLTGLNGGYIERADLRVEHMRFCTELLRGEGKVVGRIDGRYKGALPKRTDEIADTDPSGDDTAAAFVHGFQYYLRSELGVTTESQYNLGLPLYKNWNYKEFQGRPVNVTDKLERVMRAQKGLHMRVEYAHYDLATPYFAARDTINHLKLDDDAFDRIEEAFFDTGHMPYIGCRDEEADGIATFIRRTSGRPAIEVLEENAEDNRDDSK
ncbi:S10 family peptidase [Cutibacterium sp. V970]|uniref:S10 family peptidase n=1 Tax=Cutibacterium sp. V970 TaxID=3446481 RepID=UPI003EDF7BEC